MYALLEKSIIYLLDYKLNLVTPTEVATSFIKLSLIEDSSSKDLAFGYLDDQSKLLFNVLMCSFANDLTFHCVQGKFLSSTIFKPEWLVPTPSQAFINIFNFFVFFLIQFNHLWLKMLQAFP